MKKRLLTVFSALVILAMTVGLFSGCSTIVGALTQPETFTVSFDLNGGELVSGELRQTVEKGGSAVAPVAVNGRNELSWNKDFSNVTSNMIVVAQWSRTPMETTDLAEYVQDRTVTISCAGSNFSSTGSGFFIDDEGTVVTNYHVIDGAESIVVQCASGGSYTIKEIVDFNPAYDLAVLKIDTKGNLYLEFADTAVKTGEQVFAVGSALGTLTGSFTAGMISSASRRVGPIECVQMDTAISHGNSGGPLVNIYGDVVGINAFSYSDGENVNFAIKPSMLEKLDMDKSCSMDEYVEWYENETSNSYSPYDENGDFYYSILNTYQYVTGSECIGFVDEYDNVHYDEEYQDCMYFYIYEYDKGEFDEYTEYLESIGYELYDTEEDEDGVDYFYICEKDAMVIELYVSEPDSYGDQYILLTVYIG